MDDQDEKFSQEDRKAPRVSGTLVEYKFEGKDATSKEAFIKDICIHGVCIFVPQTVELHAVMCLDIFLFGDNTPINAKGKVIWQKSSGNLGYINVGVEFLEMSDEHKKTLSDHIEKNYRGVEGTKKDRENK